jgi:Subtilisin inhibitor-like
VGVLALLLVLALAMGGGGATDAAAAPAAKPISLTITFWADEQTPLRFERWTLRCNPRGGSLPTRKVACRRLADTTPSAFAPVPTDVVCTQVYGGPQKAVVKGTFGIRRIWASFRRRNGCEIDRWKRFSPWLLPTASLAP